MAIKTILLPFRESDTSEDLLETAAATALRFDAHLDVLYVHADPEELLPYATLGLSAKMRESITESATRSSAEQGTRLKALFETVCSRRGLARHERGEAVAQPGARWVEASGVRNEQIARFGRLNDLVMMPRPKRISPPPSSFDAAVRESGRPVLMVPRNTAHPMQGRRIAIGWNGSKEAAQAIAAAGPFFAGAESVHVLCSTKRMRQRPNGDDVVTYLACHGVPAENRVFEASARSVGEILLGEARAIGCDLLVIGGYSRSRLRDVVVGGVTGHLMSHADMPVLMVH